MAIVQGGFDLLYTKIGEALETYSDTQDTADQFTVIPDQYRMFPSGTETANVFYYLNAIQPSEMNVEGYFQYDATYFIDMVVQAKGNLSAVAYQKASVAAGIRLRGLIQQCLNALFVPGDFRLGMPTGTISKKPMPSINILQVESQTGERPIAAARMTLEVGMCFEPGAVEGTPIDSYSITSTLWSALIEP